MGEVCYQKIHWEESFLLNTWKKNVSTRSILFVCKAGVGTVYGARQQRTLWSTQTRINLECFVSLSFTSSRESIWWKFIVRVLLLWSRHPAELVKKKSRYHDDVIKWKHFLRYWPFVREFTCHRWIPHRKASDAELWCFRWSAPEQTVELTIVRLVIWDAIAPIMTSM